MMIPKMLPATSVVRVENVEVIDAPEGIAVEPRAQVSPEAVIKEV